jgi:hypothetical protein
MSKANLFRIAQTMHQTQQDHLQEIRRAIWEEVALAPITEDEHRRLFDEGYWEEGDDSIIF